jgi:hypothetical protein
MPTSGVATFATTHRVRNWVHRRPANSWTDTLPTIPSGFANHNAAVLAIADHTDRCPAGTGNTSDFATGERDLSPATFAGVECRPHTGTAAELSAATRLHLDIVYDSAERY